MELSRLIKRQVREFLLVNKPRLVSPPPPLSSLLVSASAAASILQTDASFALGRAGLGAACFNSLDNPLVWVWKGCKHAAIVVEAELLAIAGGLGETRRRGLMSVIVESDSLMAIGYVNGRFPWPRELEGALKPIWWISSQFLSTCFVSIPRVMNVTVHRAYLDKVLVDDAPFDVCSCQFAMYYSWSTEARAWRALENVSKLLRPGGIFIGTMPDANVIIKKLREAEGLAFGNSVYWVRFDDEFADKKFKSLSPFGIKYKFHLEDAVDSPEWIVPFLIFKEMAEKCGFELVFVKNSHTFVDEYLKIPEYVDLMRRLGALGDGNRDQSTLSRDEWEAAYLYLAFLLRKRDDADSQTVGAKRRDKGKMHIEKQDIMYISR
ncbi:hypothetical protein Droror1_Dr00014949 [Drosera rotundifolia]